MNESASGLTGQSTGMWLPSPAEIGVEDWILSAVLWLKLAVEAMGALIIGIGVIVATYQFIRTFFSPGSRDYNPIRLTLARYLALALEFQVGADILSTAVSPSWDQIGKLAAIVFIRTALNYFLMHEMREEDRREADDDAAGEGKADKLINPTRRNERNSL
jgi:uncharacterized membrane protein